MHHKILENMLRSQDQTPVKIQVVPRRTGTPPGLLIPNEDFPVITVNLFRKLRGLLLKPFTCKNPSTPSPADP
jgi:hypothetical protein